MICSYKWLIIIHVFSQSTQKYVGLNINFLNLRKQSFHRLRGRIYGGKTFSQHAKSLVHNHKRNVPGIFLLFGKYNNNKYNKYSSPYVTSLTVSWTWISHPRFLLIQSIEAKWPFWPPININLEKKWINISLSKCKM